MNQPIPAHSTCEDQSRAPGKPGPGGNVMASFRGSHSPIYCRRSAC
jgi:hypothetical protein